MMRTRLSYDLSTWYNDLLHGPTIGSSFIKYPGYCVRYVKLVGLELGYENISIFHVHVPIECVSSAQQGVCLCLYNI
jgi:hypothetical protein